MDRFRDPATRAELLLRAPPFGLFLLALLFVFQYDPLHRPLLQDPGIFAFLSQLVAQGHVPHQSAFNEQSSLTYFFGGAAMRLGDLFGVHHLIALRAASMVVAGVVVVLTYVTGKRFAQSEWVGIGAGLVMVGFSGYFLRAAIALEPKSFMLVFGLTTLYLLSRRSWFWAGVTASATGLAWQIGWGYLVVALVLAFLQGGATLTERLRAVLLTLGAAVGVFAVYLAYFIARGAAVEMLQQTFLAPGVMHNVNTRTFDERWVKLARTFTRGFGAHSIFGVLGASGLVVWLAERARARSWRAGVLRVGDALFGDPRTSGTLLVTFGFLLYSLLDFQNYPDWIPLLPFVSIFAVLLLRSALGLVSKRLSFSPRVERAAGMALACAILLLSASQTAYATRGALRNTWQAQQAVADELNGRIPRDAPVWLLGKAELLFFMQRQNLNKYIYLLGRVDAAADAFEPGGFETMFREAQAQRPVLYALGRFKPGKFSTRARFELVRASTAAYTRLKRCRALGAGAWYAPPELARALYPAGVGNCLSAPP
jgi:hypothetical protein